jgi:hypothetical protein
LFRAEQQQPEEFLAQDSLASQEKGNLEIME